MRTPRIIGRIIGLAAIVATSLSGTAFAVGDRVGVAGPVVPDAQAALPEASAGPLLPGADIVLGERITTDANGEAEVLFLDRSSTRIAPNSEIVIDQFAFAADTGAGTLHIGASKGMLRFNGGAISKQDAVEIRTPTAILGVRGGIAVVEILPDGGTRGTFLYGESLTMTTTSGDVIRMTRPGFFAEIGPNGHLTGPIAATPAQLRGLIVGLSGHGTGKGSGAGLALSHGALAPAAGEINPLAQLHAGGVQRLDVIHNLNSIQLSPVTLGKSFIPVTSPSPGNPGQAAGGSNPGQAAGGH